MPDTSDYSKFGAAPGPVAPAPASNGRANPNVTSYLEISGVVGVNTEPMNGVFINQGRTLQLSPTLRAGQAVSDTIWLTVASKDRVAGAPTGWPAACLLAGSTVRAWERPPPLHL
ncbi:MAG: hypothetical protein HY820_27655 [Acidobacteria bacterium]|nr:hypothetical protein [Acidobacteriota bacterium]